MGGAGRWVEHIIYSQSTQERSHDYSDAIDYTGCLFICSLLYHISLLLTYRTSLNESPLQIKACLDYKPGVSRLPALFKAWVSNAGLLKEMNASASIRGNMVDIIS